MLTTAQASTSGTSIDFTSIPSWVKRITVMLNGVSTNGTGNVQIQLGAGSAVTSGYSSFCGLLTNTSTTAVQSITTGFQVVGTQAASLRYGTFQIINITGNTWHIFGGNYDSGGPNVATTNGSLALSGTLDRVRIIGSATGNPSDTFDAGTINIMYE